jgi:hypothetical protein
MLELRTRSSAAASLLILAAATAGAQAPAPPQAQAPAAARPSTREECEAAYPASWGRPGKDVVWIPTFDTIVFTMLSMAKVTSRDHVLDLGAGDGKIPIAAAKPPFDARAIGIEYDPDLAKRASCLVHAEGLDDKVKIVQGDIFKEEFGRPSVVTLYLLPQLNLCVRHRLLAMEPGTRVVSHQFSMADWDADEHVQMQGRDVNLWIVPARVDAVWDFEDSQKERFTIDLRQSFGKIEGEITRNGVSEPLRTASLRGVELRFTYGTGSEAVEFSGTVRGDEITGVLRTALALRNAVGRLQGTRRGAPWAEMASDCARYYER